MSLPELAADMTIEDLRSVTNAMADRVFDLVDDCCDDDVVFLPDDPDAYDSFAAVEEEKYISWTLAHVIVHITASSETYAAEAAELARGVQLHGRTRYETPWETVKTIQQCRHRIKVSRRICQVSLGLWPDEPHMEYTRVPWEGMPELTPVAYFLLGPMHADDHLAQIAEIVRQAQAARQWGIIP